MQLFLIFKSSFDILASSGGFGRIKFQVWPLQVAKDVQPRIFFEKLDSVIKILSAEALC